MKKIFLTILMTFMGLVLFAIQNVEIINPKTDTLTIENRYWGMVTSDEIVSVVSKFPGRISSAYKNEGDRIEKGELLYKVDRELTGMKYNLIEERSPISGIIIKKSASEGQLIGPSMPVYTIINDKKLFISISIFSEEIEEIKNAKGIILTKNEKKYSGKLYRIVPFGDPMTGMITAKFNFNKLKLIPYERVAVDIILKEKKGITLPISTILTDRDDNYYVFTVRNGKAVKTIITLGLQNEYAAIIETGITTKDKVISIGAHIVKDGEEVNIVK
jgi:multidrug efflux pump subunit AcrA (membrane-fusion protein)